MLGCGFFRATGPWVCKNWGWCSSASAPVFAEPTLRVQIAFPLQGGRWHGEAVTDEGGFLKRAPTDFRWTVGAAISRPQAFPFRGRWLAEGQTDEGNGPSYAGGPFPMGRRGRRPLQAGTPGASTGAGQEGATGAPGSSRPTNGAAFYRGIPAFQSRRGGPMWPPAGRSGTGPYEGNGTVPASV